MGGVLWILLWVLKMPCVFSVGFLLQMGHFFVWIIAGSLVTYLSNSVVRGSCKSNTAISLLLDKAVATSVESEGRVSE